MFHLIFATVPLFSSFANSQSHNYFTLIENHPVGSEILEQVVGDIDGYNGNSSIWDDYYSVDENLPSTYESSLSLEAPALKIALVLVALWYIFILFFTQNGNLFSALNIGGACPATDDQGEVKIVDANLFVENAGPHPMQEQVFGMFLDSEDQDDSSVEVPGIVQEINSMCSRSAFFYGQNGGFMAATMMLKRMLMTHKDPMQMLETAMTLRPFLNPKLWYTGLMHAKHSRTDMEGIVLPCALDAMPDSFVSGLVEKGRSRKKKKDHCIRLDSHVGRDNGIENKLWYFREDVMVNSHHWYWHMSWPLLTRDMKNQKIMMNRRGELFYFVHRAMLQRYNIERLTNNMEIATALNYKEPILPEYNAHLTEANSGQDWVAREGVKFVQDIDHSQNPSDPIMIRIPDWFMRRDRVFRAIKESKWVLGKGTRSIPRDNRGIDELGNTLEAVDISVNPGYYGQDGYHNDGHRVLGLIADPEYESKIPPGVMADPATAMRDPIFYRFHTNVNDMFELYKGSLGPYGFSWGTHPLHFPGLYLKSVKVITKKGMNKLNTYYKKKRFPLHMGLAFNTTDLHEADVEVCSKHLDHEEFDYEFEVYKSPCIKAKSATFRVFVAPRYGPKGQRLSIHEQRKFYVHLDLFNVDVPPGKSILRRSSISSSLTIPHQQTLAQINGQQNGPNCGCGWPHHLLLPKGSQKGTPFDLFVMATEGSDWIAPQESGCSKPFIFCGIQNGLYPDKRPMGYPFDRKVGGRSASCGNDYASVWFKVCRLFGGWRNVRFVEEWIEGLENVKVEELTIYHH